MAGLAAGPARASEDVAEAGGGAPPSDAGVAAPSRDGQRPYELGGLVIPLFNYNSTDGVGLGVGVEVYDRLRGADHGYRNRWTAWTFWTTSGTYTSNYLQYERRGDQFFLARIAYRAWRDMLFIGTGGRAATVARPPSVATGNLVYGPSLLFSAIVPLPDNPLYVWTQAYARYNVARPGQDTILEAQDPFGTGEALYFDLSAGVALQEVDRWPVPNKGVRFETSVRWGGTAIGRYEPLVGLNAEIIGWWPLVGEWLVLGGRTVADRTWGKRPWWEKEWLGGQFRDEVAYEQAFTGYARSRVRGDGHVATLLELRGKLGRTRHPFWDVAFYLSAYAETAFLFDGDDPGPHLPTVGISPQLLWQGVVQIRPFVSWGWVSPAPGDPRQPYPVFGVSVFDPL